MGLYARDYPRKPINSTKMYIKIEQKITKPKKDFIAQRLYRELSRAKTEARKIKIREKINAHFSLYSAP